MENEQTAKSELSGLEAKLPLVLEIVPGQAREGVVDIYQPGTYNRKTLKQLVDMTLAKDMAIEDRQIVDEVKKQLSGGILLYNGKEIHSSPLDYAVKEKTAAGEEYLYVRLRAIKPQEGGQRSLSYSLALMVR
jgi:hypothetical protein